MTKVIIKVKCMLRSDELDRIKTKIENDLNENGFVVLDDTYDVIVIDE